MSDHAALEMYFTVYHSSCVEVVYSIICTVFLNIACYHNNYYLTNKLLYYLEHRVFIIKLTRLTGCFLVPLTMSLSDADALFQINHLCLVFDHHLTIFLHESMFWDEIVKWQPRCKAKSINDVC